MRPAHRAALQFGTPVDFCTEIWMRGTGTAVSAKVGIMGSVEISAMFPTPLPLYPALRRFWNYVKWLDQRQWGARCLHRVHREGQYGEGLSEYIAIFRPPWLYLLILVTLQ